jgi:hypothetical protein
MGMITLDDAKNIIATAEKKAIAIGQPMNVLKMFSCQNIFSSLNYYHSDNSTDL